jgi:hypothetical protein
MEPPYELTPREAKEFLQHAGQLLWKLGRDFDSFDEPTQVLVLHLAEDLSQLSDSLYPLYPPRPTP